MPKLSDLDIPLSELYILIDRHIESATHSIVENYFPSLEKYARAFGNRESLIGLRRDLEGLAQKAHSEEEDEEEK